MEIFFEGITLRPWSITDAPALALIADNKKIADNLRDGFPFPYSLKDAHNWLNLILPENIPPRFFAITIDKKLIGSIGIVAKSDIYRKNFEIGYFLSEEFWGKGYSYEGAVAWRDHALNEIKVPTLYAMAHIDNNGSNRILQKLGMQQKNQYLSHECPCNWYELDNKK